MSASVELTTAVICEDIRIEMNNKYSLIGVFDGILEIPNLKKKDKKVSFPFKPFCIFARFHASVMDENFVPNVLMNMVCSKHDKEHFKSELNVLKTQNPGVYVATIKFPVHPSFHEGSFQYNWSSDHGASWNPLVTTFVKITQ